MATSSTSYYERYRERRLESPSFAEAYGRYAREIRAIDELIGALDEAREGKGLSKAELARRVGKQPEAVRRLFSSAGANPTLKTVLELAGALDVKLVLRTEDESVDAA